MVKFSSTVKVLLTTGFMSSVFMPSIIVPTALAQSANSNEARYSSLLQEIADVKLNLAKQRLYVANQKEQIKGLNGQIKNIGPLKASIAPMIAKMTAGIERQINADYPFEMDRRQARLQALKDTIKDPNTKISDKYRKALNVYKLEVNYGQSMEAKKGNHPTNPTIRIGDDKWVKNDDGSIKVDEKTGEREEIFDGTYLRYGRLAYVYLDANGVNAMRFDLKSREWVDVPKGKVVEIRKAVRIANGEAAPRVVMVPVIPAPLD